MKKNKFLFLISIFIPLLVILLHIFNIGKVLDLKILDWKFRLRGQRSLSDKVFIVAIGDESVSPEGVGRWPWRRAYIASFLNWIQPYKPESVVLDILFTEPSEDFPNDDQLLAGQASFAKNFYFPFFCIPESEEESKGYREELQPVNKELIEKIELASTSDFKNAEFIEARYLVMPIPKFSARTKGSGYVNAFPDNDGVTRRIPLVMSYKGKVIPNVAFDAVLNYLKADKKDITIKPGKHIKLRTQEREISIPIDKKGQMLVNHAGGFDPDVIPMASFVGIIASHDATSRGKKPPVDLKKLKNRIVFLGLTATGTADLRPTPFTSLFPMVGFLATATSNILNNEFLIPSPIWINFLLILTAGLLASLITIRFKAVPSALLNISFILVFFVVSFLLFKRNYVINDFYIFASVLLSYAGVTIYRFTGEEKEKKAIRNMFQRYVSSQVVDTILEHPDEIRLGGERRVLSIFFSDIRGFTSMSEKLNPEQVVGILNEYLTEMIDIIFKFKGTLDKFMGDAIMAIWGAPAGQKNHAELAVRAAFEMKKKMESLHAKWEKEGKVKISVGMGINTGEVVVGNMGSDQFADYTAIGDNVNLAARLEENAAGGQIIISESTYEQVKDIVEVKKLAPLKVKGKEKPVNVYEVKNLK
ncbi:MAG: CHASE2 domain-containing protein [Elusimicrobiota bacterium]